MNTNIRATRVEQIYCTLDRMHTPRLEYYAFIILASMHTNDVTIPALSFVGVQQEHTSSRKICFYSWLCKGGVLYAQYERTTHSMLYGMHTPRVHTCVCMYAQTWCTLVRLVCHSTTLASSC